MLSTTSTRTLLTTTANTPTHNYTRTQRERERVRHIYTHTRTHTHTHTYIYIYIYIYIFKYRIHTHTLLTQRYSLSRSYDTLSRQMIYSVNQSNQHQYYICVQTCAWQLQARDRTHRAKHKTQRCRLRINKQHYHEIQQ